MHHENIKGKLCLQINFICKKKAQPRFLLVGLFETDVLLTSVLLYDSISESQAVAKSQLVKPYLIFQHISDCLGNGINILAVQGCHADPTAADCINAMFFAQAINLG